VGSLCTLNGSDVCTRSGSDGGVAAARWGGSAAFPSARTGVSLLEVLSPDDLTAGSVARCGGGFSLTSNSALGRRLTHGVAIEHELAAEVACGACHDGTGFTAPCTLTRLPFVWHAPILSGEVSGSGHGAWGHGARSAAAAAVKHADSSEITFTTKTRHHGFCDVPCAAPPQATSACWAFDLHTFSPALRLALVTVGCGRWSLWQHHALVRPT